MIAMHEDIIRFMRAKLDADEHNVVMLTSLAPPGVDVTLDSTIPMIDMVREVTDLFALTAGLHSPADVDSASRDYQAGWTDGLEAAVRLLAAIYHEASDYKPEWRPQFGP
jgi:hypothetical protein